MNSKPIIIKITLFFLGIIGLLIAAWLLFGPNTFFTPTRKYVLFFNQSVNGLEEGAPVKFKGVRIGSVKNIVVTFKEKENRVSVPVIIEIDRAAILNEKGSAKSLEKLEEGLCAKLQFISFVTGMRFIELDYTPIRGKPLDFCHINAYNYPEIPTIASNLADVDGNFGRLAEKFNKIDVVKIANQLDGILSKLNEGVQSVDFKAIGQNIQTVSGKVRSIVEAPTFSDMIEDWKCVAAHAKRVTQLLSEKAPELVQELEAIPPAVNTTVGEVQKAVQNILSMTDPSSTLYNDIEYAVQQVAEAAQALQGLADYLERHPESILAGKSGKH